MSREQSTKRKFLRWTIRIFLLLAVACGVLVWMIFYTEFDYHITVSKETTFLTEPLDEAGRIDYPAALNQMLGNEVTPEQNAFPPLLRLHPEYCAKYRARPDFKTLCERLNLPPEYFDPSSDRPRFVDFETHLDQQLEAARQEWNDRDDDFQPYIKELSERLGVECPEKESFDWSIDALSRLLRAQHISARMGPWTADILSVADIVPVQAEWLAKNDQVLDVIVELSRRPHWYKPVPDRLDIQVAHFFVGHIFFTNDDVTDMVLQEAEGLALRAMRSITAGETARAWEDIAAMKRLARHLADSKFHTAYITACEIEEMTYPPVTALLVHPSLSAAQRIEYFSELQSFERLPDFAEILDRRCRLAFLCIVTSIPKHGLFKTLAPHVDFRESGLPHQNGHRNLMRRMVSWDDLLGRYNRFFDELVAAARTPCTLQREERIDEIMRRHLPPTRDPPFPQGDWAILSGDLTDRVFDFLCSFHSYELTASTERELALRQCERLTEIGLRLALYYDAEGKYPIRLSELAGRDDGLPDMSSGLLDDPFTEADRVKYIKSPDGRAGCLVYGIGEDCTDRDGTYDVFYRSGNIVLHLGPEGYRLPPAPVD